jgi:hypothetical protein
LQPESITRRFGAIVAALITVGAGAAPFADAPEYLPLFAPRAQRASYHIAVSADGLDAVLAALAADESLVHVPGAWQPRSEPPQDAFGAGGDYNRWTLARLYGATQVRVARGPRQERGRIVESWILISPYPDPSMTRLEPGTMRITVHLPGQDQPSALPPDIRAEPLERSPASLGALCALSPFCARATISPFASGAA